MKQLHPDLFGAEAPLPRTARRPIPAPLALNLFDAAAERAALLDERPRSQHRAELLAPAGFSCLCGAPLAKQTIARNLPCKGCGK